MEPLSNAEWSKKLNVNKSTVSKVLRHCSGVDSELREMILMQVGSVYQRQVNGCDIYCIIPDNPKWFWSELERGLTERIERMNYTCKLNIYSKLEDENVILHYLEEARLLEARVVVLTAKITDRILEKIEELNRTALVILLSEYESLINCPYVGSDPVQEGRQMGQAYLEHYGQRQLIVIDDGLHGNCERRIQGFMTQLSMDKREQAITICLQKNIYQNYKLLPAKLAAKLACYIKDNNAYCLYLPFGIHDVRLILQKAGMLSNCVCLCHDSAIFSVQGMRICQDLYQQGIAVMNMAADFMKTERYPASKYLFVPSVFRV